jgi:predicted HAD superfamily Cof-like phosphohydrolase
MIKFGQEVKNKAGLSDAKTNKLRIELIKEELSELTEAMNDKNLLEVADALTDILYVTYGAGHAFGIDLDRCFEEIQSSNMSKLGEDGKPIYNEEGKVMKGPNYFKPDVSREKILPSLILKTAITACVFPSEKVTKECSTPISSFS